MTSSATEQSAIQEEEFVPDLYCYYCGDEKRLRVETYDFKEGAMRCGVCLSLFYVKIGDYVKRVVDGRWKWVGVTERPISPAGLKGGKLLEFTGPYNEAGRLPPDIVRELTGDHVHQAIRQAIWSAHRSYESEDHLASAVMCRYAVQAALLHIGIEDKRTSEMIKDARQKGLISEIVEQESRAAILIGNKAAHPQIDVTMAVGKEDALIAFGLVAKIIKELFPSDAPSD